LVCAALLTKKKYSVCIIERNDRLGGCIGCGCLSLTHCSLYNAGDGAATLGDGPRYLLGDVPPGSSD
jgi:hypothetical protein